MLNLNLNKLAIATVACLAITSTHAEDKTKKNVQLSELLTQECGGKKGTERAKCEDEVKTAFKFFKTTEKNS